MIKCLECGFETQRLQWTHFKYKCTGRFINSAEYKKIYKDAVLVDPSLAKRTAVTEETLINKYGENNGKKRWKDYKYKQAESNTFAYKQKKFGWSQEQFNEYNKSRSQTIENMIKRYGEIDGTNKWLEYCERQAYTNTLDYYVDKYGKDSAKKELEKTNFMKSHSIESVMLRNFCTRIEAKIILESYDKHKGYSSLMEIELVEKIENMLKCQLKYTQKTKQYCIYTDKVNFYDIVHNNKAIEFNGDYWHCNPNLYEADYIHPHSGLSASQIWANDTKKLQGLEKRNIEVIVIWEEEYNLNPEQTIKRCVEWLK